jgi:hypothetical protein
MFQSFRMIRREARKKAGRPLNYNILHEAQGTGRKAQGVWCHVAAPSLGHDASLSFVVIGRSLQIASEACSYRNWLIRKLVNSSIR